jgi:hypothetical protein
MAVQQLAVNTLSNPADREKLLKVLSECSNSMVRIDAEKDLIKEAIADTSKQLQIPKKLIAKMIKVYHKQNYDEEVAVHEQFETLYETVVK